MLFVAFFFITVIFLACSLVSFVRSPFVCFSLLLFFAVASRIRLHISSCFLNILFSFTIPLPFPSHFIFSTANSTFLHLVLSFAVFSHSLHVSLLRSCYLCISFSFSHSLFIFLFFFVSLLHSFSLCLSFSISSYLFIYLIYI